jgi:hypothetical protein
VSCRCRPWAGATWPGPFERLGPEAFLALGSTLVGVSTLDVMVGIWLWRGQRRGLRLALATDVAAMALAAGFELPLLLGGVPLRAALAWAGRQGLEGDERPIVREETL